MLYLVSGEATELVSIIQNKFILISFLSIQVSQDVYAKIKACTCSSI